MQHQSDLHGDLLEDMDQETIGGRLKRLREAAELTQTELAMCQK
jgi:hypothetical protein